ncbi:hypothetical protein [Collimonas arenae]|uniref:hypothetical protein n=1 Tax=Collimonas arenae TaxID=279058 RepID=UPI0007788347|nr:hypothetical protein [Collimonas arenae]
MPIIITKVLSKVRLAAYFVCTLSTLCFPPAHAQLLKYNSEAELFGAAAVSPDSVFQVLQRVISLCSKYSQPLQSFGEHELKNWVSRHRLYLEESAVARRELIAMLNSPSLAADMKQNIKNLLEVVSPKIIDSQFETMRIYIEEVGVKELQAHVCSDYIQSIADGKFDLSKNDPALTAYFDQRISRRGGEITTSSSVASADRLILGRWRHISLVRTFDKKTVAPQVSDGKTIVGFFPNGTWSLATASNLSSGTYRWLDTDHIEQTILQSGVAIQVGMVSIKQIRVNAEDLEITTVQTRTEMDKLLPAVKPGERRANEVVITSVFSREMNNP